MTDIDYTELTVGSDTIRFDGTGAGTDGYYITQEGIEGWYSMPSMQVTSTARGQGDGNHDIQDDDIHYEARVITMHTMIVGDRTDTLGKLARLRRCSHRHVRIRVVDELMDAYCEGRATIDATAKRGEQIIPDVTVTIECDRPEILSFRPQRYQLLPPIESDRVGLSYGSAARGLAYPLSYGAAAVDARNVCTLVNNGSSRAYPVFTVQGPWPDGVQLTFPGLDMSLDYSQAVGSVPLVLDSRSRTASIGGLDVSRNLRQRGFPTVPPGGTPAVNLQSVGDGYVTVECRDTYM